MLIVYTPTPAPAPTLTRRQTLKLKPTPRCYTCRCMFCVDINGVYRHRLIGASRDVVVKERKAVIRIERSLETFDVPDCLPRMHTATPAVSGTSWTSVMTKALSKVRCTQTCSQPHVLLVAKSNDTPWCV